MNNFTVMDSSGASGFPFISCVQASMLPTANAAAAAFKELLWSPIPLQGTTYYKPQLNQPP